MKNSQDALKGKHIKGKQVLTLNPSKVNISKLFRCDTEVILKTNRDDPMGRWLNAGMWEPVGYQIKTGERERFTGPDKFISRTEALP